MNNLGTAAASLSVVVKLDGGYNGYLQHYVNSQGVVTDMTLTCGM